MKRRRFLNTEENGDKMDDFHEEELQRKKRILSKNNVKSTLRPQKMFIGLWLWIVGTGRTSLNASTLIALSLLLSLLPSFCLHSLSLRGEGIEI